MNVSFYPGCSLDGTAREYRTSTEVVAHKLGIELQELEGWNCCGASSATASSEALAVSLSARNLYIAEKAGKALIVPCAACFQRLKHAEKALKSGEAVEGVPAGYKGVPVRYIVDFFWNDVGEKAVAAKVVKPLKGLNVVCYYGCLSSRPPKVTDAARPEDPQEMDKLMKTLGVEVKAWSYKTECCGGDLSFTRPEIAKKLMDKLIEMAKEAGADCIVTGCPLCLSNLDMGQLRAMRAAHVNHGTPIFYFTELMGLAFGEPSAANWLSAHMVNPLPLLRQKGLLSA